MCDLEYQYQTLRKFPLQNLCQLISRMKPLIANRYHNDMQIRSTLNWTTSKNKGKTMYLQTHLAVESTIKCF